MPPVRGRGSPLCSGFGSTEGLYLANTTQIYPEDRGMNYSVYLGQKIASIVQTQ